MTREEFTKFAVDDTQATIRALDVKCGAVLVLLLAPFAGFGKVFAVLEGLGPPVVWVPVAAVFLGLWGLALLCFVRALAPQGNPADHIDASGATGIYYAGGLYPFPAFHRALFVRQDVCATYTVQEFASKLPTTSDEIVTELAFEQMKLCYIRDVKMRLSRVGFIAAEVWLALGLCIYLVSRYAS